MKEFRARLTKLELNLLIDCLTVSEIYFEIVRKYVQNVEYRISVENRKLFGTYPRSYDQDESTRSPIARLRANRAKLKKLRKLYRSDDCFVRDRLKRRLTAIVEGTNKHRDSFFLNQLHRQTAVPKH